MIFAGIQSRLAAFFGAATAPATAPQQSARALWVPSHLIEHLMPLGDDVPRYSLPGMIRPTWSNNDLTRQPKKSATRSTPRPIYGPEYSHKPLTAAQYAKAIEAANLLDDTPRHGPDGVAVWSDRELARAKAWRDHNVQGGRGPSAGALKGRPVDMAPWQVKALAKAAKLNGGGSMAVERWNP